MNWRRSHRSRRRLGGPVATFTHLWRGSWRRAHHRWRWHRCRLWLRSGLSTNGCWRRIRCRRASRRCIGLPGALVATFTHLWRGRCRRAHRRWRWCWRWRRCRLWLCIGLSTNGCWRRTRCRRDSRRCIALTGALVATFTHLWRGGCRRAHRRWRWSWHWSRCRLRLRGRLSTNGGWRRNGCRRGHGRSVTSLAGLTTGSGCLSRCSRWLTTR